MGDSSASEVETVQWDSACSEAEASLSTLRSSHYARNEAGEDEGLEDVPGLAVEDYYAVEDCCVQDDDIPQRRGDVGFEGDADKKSCVLVVGAPGASSSTSGRRNDSKSKEASPSPSSQMKNNNNKVVDEKNKNMSSSKTSTTSTAGSTSKTSTSTTLPVMPWTVKRKPSSRRGLFCFRGVFGSKHEDDEENGIGPIPLMSDDIASAQFRYGPIIESAWEKKPVATGSSSAGGETSNRMDDGQSLVGGDPSTANRANGVLLEGNIKTTSAPDAGGASSPLALEDGRAGAARAELRHSNGTTIIKKTVNLQVDTGQEEAPEMKSADEDNTEEEPGSRAFVDVRRSLGVKFGHVSPYAIAARTKNNDKQKESSTSSSPEFTWLYSSAQPTTSILSGTTSAAAAAAASSTTLPPSTSTSSTSALARPQSSATASTSSPPRSLQNTAGTSDSSLHRIRSSSSDGTNEGGGSSSASATSGTSSTAAPESSVTTGSPRPGSGMTSNANSFNISAGGGASIGGTSLLGKSGGNTRGTAVQQGEATTSTLGLFPASVSSAAAAILKDVEIEFPSGIADQKGATKDSSDTSSTDPVAASFSASKKNIKIDSGSSTNSLQALEDTNRPPTASGASNKAKRKKTNRPSRRQAKREELLGDGSMITEVFGTVFSLRKPRDVMAGTSSGLKTLSRGAAVGLGSLIGSPIVGLRDAGFSGLVKGVGFGICGFAAATGAGALVGSFQIARGLYYTPSALFFASSTSRHWNSDEKRWELYSLQREKKRLIKQRRRAFQPMAGGIFGPGQQSPSGVSNEIFSSSSSSGSDGDGDDSSDSACGDKESQGSSRRSKPSMRRSQDSSIRSFRLSSGARSDSSFSDAGSSYNEEAKARTRRSRGPRSSTSRSAAGGQQEQRSAEENVVSLYTVLGLSANANSNTIRKAYYKKSLACHPDKNPNDPEAVKKFHQITEAYQVLSDPHRRRIYDESGENLAAATDAMTKIDPSVFFAVLFGSHHFEPYVGKLHLAQYAEAEAALQEELDRQLFLMSCIHQGPTENANFNPAYNNANTSGNAGGCSSNVANTSNITHDHSSTSAGLSNNGGTTGAAGGSSASSRINSGNSTPQLRSAEPLSGLPRLFSGNTSRMGSKMSSGAQTGSSGTGPTASSPREPYNHATPSEQKRVRDPMVNKSVLEALKIRKLEKRLRFYQRRREVDCALNLEKKFRPFVNGEVSNEEFEKQITEEARKLKKAANGREMLKAIGWVYRNQARQQDSGLLRTAWSRFRDQAHFLKARAKTVGTVFFAQSVVFVRGGSDLGAPSSPQETSAAARDEGDDKTTDQNQKNGSTDSQQGADANLKGRGRNTSSTPSSLNPRALRVGAYVRINNAEEPEYHLSIGRVTRILADDVEVDMTSFTVTERRKNVEVVDIREAQQQNLPVFMDVLWQVTLLDIQSTSRQVCRKLHRDTGASKQERAKRIEALARVGKIFLQVAATRDSEEDRSGGKDKHKRKHASGRRSSSSKGDGAGDKRTSNQRSGQKSQRMETAIRVMMTGAKQEEIE
ncbi:unnamed protein product [Amoebophrya sp. A25]|nr:unnamed protein product [Amoebophrya sp. A25]|eukprot:GSA25T00018296001.1